MLLKHSIVTVARSSRKRKEKWFIFVLEMIVAVNNGTNFFIKSQSTSHFRTYVRLYEDFVIIAQRDCRRNLTTMKWSDATTAQNPMTQFDAIISDAAFLFSFSRNIYEILMVFNDTVWILEKMFIMKLHKILLHLQRKLWHMFCSTSKKGGNVLAHNFQWAVSSYIYVFYCKVHIFWEGHKILQNLHLTFDWHYIGQK